MLLDKFRHVTTRRVERKIFIRFVELIYRQFAICLQVMFVGKVVGYYFLFYKRLFLIQRVLFVVKVIKFHLCTSLFVNTILK